MIFALCIILGLAVGGVLGFYQGVRYTTNKLLPHILARMDTRKLANVANEASKLRDPNQL